MTKKWISFAEFPPNMQKKNMKLLDVRHYERLPYSVYGSNRDH